MLHFITTHGLPLLFLVVMLESFGLPLPGETALIGFAVLASQHHYPLAVVIGLAALAAIIGDNLGYWLIGRQGGSRLIGRWPWLARRFERIRLPIEQTMQRHGAKVVFFGRFVAILRFTAAWIAGLTAMPWGKFLFWNAAGGIVWATLVGCIAYFGGQAAAEAISRYGYYGVAVLIVVGLLVWWLTHRLSKKVERHILHK